MISRTYETVTIVWADGASWSGGYSRDEAQAAVDFAARRPVPRIGTVEVSTFTVEIKPEYAHLYRPGV